MQAYRALLDYLLCDELTESLPTETVLELMMPANPDPNPNPIPDPNP